MPAPGFWNYTTVANFRFSNVDIFGTFSVKPRLMAPPDVNSAPPKKRGLSG